MKITNHHELRRDISIDCSEPKLTDQSFKNQCDINVIMANYAKTGVFGHVNRSEPKYIDNSNIPSLEQAFEVVYAAEEAFYELPADIRKLMDNNPSQLENFISNKENADLLLKHGVLMERKKPEESETSKLTKEIGKLTEKLGTGGSHAKAT